MYFFNVLLSIIYDNNHKSNRQVTETEPAALLYFMSNILDGKYRRYWFFKFDGTMSTEHYVL